jgi:hypothetical protein
MKMKYVARLETVSVSVSRSSEEILSTMRSTSVVGSVFYCRTAPLELESVRRPKGNQKRKGDLKCVAVGSCTRIYRYYNRLHRN